MDTRENLKKGKETFEDEEELQAKQPDEQAMVAEFLRAQRNFRPPSSKVLRREDYELEPPVLVRTQNRAPKGQMPKIEMWQILGYVVSCGLAAYGAYTLGAQTKDLIYGFFQKVHVE